MLDRQIAEQTARRDLAVALKTPDVTAGAAYTYDAQPEFSHGYRASVALTVPLFTRHNAAVVVEDAELARLKAEREATAIELRGTVAAALARATAARDQLSRSTAESLPRAQEVERMAQDSYSSGQSGLVDAAPGAAIHARCAAAQSRRGRGVSTRARRSRTRDWRAVAMMTATRIRARDQDCSPALDLAVAARSPLAGCRHAPVEEVATESAVEVEVKPRRVGEIEGHINVTGVVTPAPGADWTIIAPEPARIAELPKAEGDRVARRRRAGALRHPDARGGRVRAGAPRSCRRARASTARARR